MITNTALHRIRTGEATPSEARSVIRSLIAEDSERAAPAVYSALRGWTWKALQMRRFDEDLDDWFRLIKAVSAALKHIDSRASVYVEGLAHLVDDSIRYAASHTRAQLVTRSHVGELLQAVERCNGRVERERLEAQAGLSRSRLSQLLTELVLAGLLERQAEGRKATFFLSDSGREVLEVWRRARRDKVPAMGSAADETYSPAEFRPVLPRPKVPKNEAGGSGAQIKLGCFPRSALYTDGRTDDEDVAHFQPSAFKLNTASQEFEHAE